MVEDASIATEAKCARCGGNISEGRRRAVRGARLCVSCQTRSEQGHPQPGLQEAKPHSTDDEPKLTIDGGQLAVGSWSESIVESSARSARLRELLSGDDREGAAALVRALPVEAQAALVVMDVDPEQVLSLTGMGADCKPAYRTDVIDLLPAELLTEVISVDPAEKKYNTELLKAMSPNAFGRTLAETLSMVDNAENRSKVTWEWLVALSEMGDANRAGALLEGVDPTLLEEAVLDHLEELDLHGLVSAGPYGPISRFRLFSEKATAAVSLAEHIEDPDTKAMIRALGEAAPELLRYIVRAAWEASGAGRDDGEVKAEEGSA